MPLSWFLWSNSLFASHFFKNVVPASAGSTILQNDFMHFWLKIPRFWPPDGLDKSNFCHLIRSFCSFGRSDRYCFAPCPHFAPPRASQSFPGSPSYRQDDPKYDQKVRIVVQSRPPMSKSTPKWPQSDQKVSIDRAVDIRKSLKSIGKMCISVKHAVHSQSDVEVTLICPKRSENTPKMCQGTPQVTPQWPQRVPKVRLKWLPNAPKWRQSRPWPWGSGSLFRFEAVLQS